MLTHDKLCAAFGLFRVWVIFIFWSANKLWLVVVHPLLTLVQVIHKIIKTWLEKNTCFGQQTKSSWQSLGFGEMVVESARFLLFCCSLFCLGRWIDEYLRSAVTELKRMRGGGLCYYLVNIWLSWEFRPLQSCCTEHWISSNSCFAVSCCGEESYVTCSNATLRPNIISALAASSWAILSITVTGKALLCMDIVRRSVLVSFALTFAEVFCLTDVCSEEVTLPLCPLKLAHNPFGVGFFSPTVLLCYRLDTKRQVSHDFSFVCWQQFIVIQFTVFWLVVLCFLCATVAHRVVGFSKL